MAEGSRYEIIVAQQVSFPASVPLFLGVECEKLAKTLNWIRNAGAMITTGFEKKKSVIPILHEMDLLPFREICSISPSQLVP